MDTWSAHSTLGALQPLSEDAEPVVLTIAAVLEDADAVAG